MAAREQMSKVDTAWLRMDRPSNLMMISGVLIFRDPLDFQRLKPVVSERFLEYPRFRQRPVQTSAGTFWEEDPEFDLDRHVQRVRLRRPGGRVRLQALMSELIAKPLDPSRPLWQFHLVEQYDGGSALIVRIHHCYADGIALIQVMLSMTDIDAKGTRAKGLAASRRRRREPGPLESLLGPLAGLAKSAGRLGSTLVDAGVELLSHPGKAIELAEQGNALSGEVLKLLAMNQDSRTRFKGKPGVAKRVAWADPIALGEVKAVGRTLGCSVNDVLLAAVAGALRAYLVAHGDRVDEVVMRAAVPVNLRPLDKAHRLGNHFGLVFLDLPIGIENPVARLFQVRSNMNALKGSYQPILALGLLAALGASPRLLQDRILGALSRNASAVMTNVPGPQQPLWFAGARLETLLFWVPQSGDIGMGVSILSYDGQVQFGLVTDQRICPDPEAVIRGFRPEFDKLLHLSVPEAMEVSKAAPSTIAKAAKKGTATSDVEVTAKSGARAAAKSGAGAAAKSGAKAAVKSGAKAAKAGAKVAGKPTTPVAKISVNAAAKTAVDSAAKTATARSKSPTKKSGRMPALAAAKITTEQGPTQDT